MNNRGKTNKNMLHNFTEAFKYAAHLLWPMWIMLYSTYLPFVHIVDIYCGVKYLPSLWFNSVVGIHYYPDRVQAWAYWANWTYCFSGDWLVKLQTQIRQHLLPITYDCICTNNHKPHKKWLNLLYGFAIWWRSGIHGHHGHDF